MVAQVGFLPLAALALPSRIGVFCGSTLRLLSALPAPALGDTVKGTLMGAY